MDNKSGSTPFYRITSEYCDIRLDIFLSSVSSDLSRSRIQSLVREGYVKVNETSSKPSYKLKVGDHVSLTIPPPEPSILTPESIEFNIIYEDDSLIVINKPPGLVVHPAPGHHSGTLVHGLLDRCQDLSGIGGVLRPGIVHRLDKDTSGLMVVAKNDRVHAQLSSQFKEGAVKKEYMALVHGKVGAKEQFIDLPISRHPKMRKKMAVAVSGGKRAYTQLKRLRTYRSSFTLLSVAIKTGRTHQIRVHLSHLGHPVVGDSVYGYGKRWWNKNLLRCKDMIPWIDRQMLHAKRLGFQHPVEGTYVEFDSLLPDDMENLLLKLNWMDIQLKNTQIS